jgi:exopolysaccharide biosynthesis polyprenyl glycosylphosphotransferase
LDARPSGNRAEERRRRLTSLPEERPAPSSRAFAHTLVNDGDGSAVVLHREALYRRLLVAADVLAFFFAVSATVLAFGEASPRLTSVVAVGLFVVGAKCVGLYDHDELVLRRSTLDELPRLFQYATLAALVFSIFDSVWLAGHVSNAAVAGLWLFLVLSLVAVRMSARQLAARYAPPERCLVVGDANDRERLSAATAGNPAVAWLGSVPLEHVINDLPELRRIAAERGAHRLVIASPHAGAFEAALNLIRGAKATGLRVSILPGVLEVVSSSVTFDHQPGLTLLGVRRFGLSQSSKALKRAFDVAGAGLALVMFGPFMLAAALCIRVETRGAALFRQQRVGRDGQVFTILKFRSMIEGADAMRDDLADQNEADGGLFKIADDPRVTRVGRFLRRCSLDELPQLLNVIRGEMSLVGPRPLVVYEDERVKGFDRRRLTLTPGMTGPWQVTGAVRLPLQEMVKLDYLYVAGWSLWSDVKIVLRTVPYMISARGQ